MQPKPIQRIFGASQGIWWLKKEGWSEGCLEYRCWCGAQRKGDWANLMDYPMNHRMVRVGRTNTIYGWLYSYWWSKRKIQQTIKKGNRNVSFFTLVLNSKAGKCNGVQEVYYAKSFAKHFKSAIEAFSRGLEVDYRIIKPELELRGIKRS